MTSSAAMTGMSAMYSDPVTQSDFDILPLR
jgi:hypothetical protein